MLSFVQRILIATFFFSSALIPTVDTSKSFPIVSITSLHKKESILRNKFNQHSMFAYCKVEDGFLAPFAHGRSYEFHLASVRAKRTSFLQEGKWMRHQREVEEKTDRG